MSYVRVVRFTDVSPERMDELSREISESDGPPEGVPNHKFRMVHDESQGTVVVIQIFETEDDMRTAAEALDQMDSADTPGSRASVDAGEVKVEMEAG